MSPDWQRILGSDTTSMGSSNHIDKLEFIKITNFCATKDIIKEVERLKTAEWEEVFADPRSEKG